MKQSKVYVTHAQSKFDYRPAQVYGELEFVTDRMYSFTPGNEVNETLLRSINSRVEAFDPETDYVLTSGSAIMTGLFFAGLGSRGIKKIRVLTWNNTDQAYAPGMLNMTGVMK